MRWLLLLVLLGGCSMLVEPNLDGYYGLTITISPMLPVPPPDLVNHDDDEDDDS
jgi:hypothetical protein